MSVYFIQVCRCLSILCQFPYYAYLFVNVFLRSSSNSFFSHILYFCYVIIKIYVYSFVCIIPQNSILISHVFLQLQIKSLCKIVNLHRTINSKLCFLSKMYLAISGLWTTFLSNVTSYSCTYGGGADAVIFIHLQLSKLYY